MKSVVNTESAAMRFRVGAVSDRRQKIRQAAPLRKGRPGKTKTIEDYEKENKRLKMENELLRDFLRSTERK